MKIRNISGQDLEVPWLGVMVEEDAVVEVPDNLAPHFLAGVDTWEAAEPYNEPHDADDTADGE